MHDVMIIGVAVLRVASFGSTRLPIIRGSRRSGVWATPGTYQPVRGIPGWNLLFGRARSDSLVRMPTDRKYSGCLAVTGGHASAASPTRP